MLDLLLQNGVLWLIQTTFNQLSQNHPQGKKKTDFITLLADTSCEVHPIKFDQIDVELVKRTKKSIARAGTPIIDSHLLEKKFDNKIVS